ncbi:MAG: hypothetical protein P8N31_06540 [Planctomycetota bacterium]|jgi:hypothetical protein|nr:hypothetical protein [Planctomycetota bacterium]MDG2143193.1 hypothetical protein [Planctomycetota bacterium]
MNLNKIIEFAAIGIGGLSLFLASFLVFALSAGIPASQVAIVGGLFPEPEVSKQASSGEVIDGAMPGIVEKTMDDILISHLDRLPTFTIQSPFADDEMAELIDKLKSTKLAYEEGVRNIEEREDALIKRDANLDEKDRILKDHMAALDRREAEMRLVQMELDNGIRVADAAKEAEWATIATGFGGDNYKQHAERLVGYKAEESAMILKYLEADQRQNITDVLAAEDFREIMAAYSKVAE